MLVRNHEGHEEYEGHEELRKGNCCSGHPERRRWVAARRYRRMQRSHDGESNARRNQPGQRRIQPWVLITEPEPHDEKRHNTGNNRTHGRV